MKIKIIKKDVYEVLSKLQTIAGRKTNLAITTAVLIKTSNSGINIISTDLETGFIGFYPAEIESEGKIAINAKKLFEIIKDFPGEEIYINEIDNFWIEILNKNNVNYKMAGMNPEDFPGIPDVENIEYFDLKSSVFKDMIEKTTFIPGSTEEKRAHINGIFFEKLLEEGVNKLRLVSTDGSRLAKVDYEYENVSGVPEEPGIIISKKGLGDLYKFLETEENIKIGYNSTNFVLKKEKETVIIRLLEGNFPEYKYIIDIKDSFNIIIERQKLLMMLKRMSIFTTDNFKGVIFNLEKGDLLVSSTNPELGEAKENLQINYELDSLEIAFNVRYFIETLNVIEDNNVNLMLKDEKSPCLIEGEKNKNFLSVIMPMRI
ncbi:MAG: DNA polymerase III subunit beta [Proteobacteria bacterium]|nr:DNA polymerase III subunit beta [Pseudomonadota bacterium]